MTDYPKICPKCGKGYIRYKTLMNMSMRREEGIPSKKVFFHDLGPKGKTCVVESSYGKEPKAEAGGRWLIDRKRNYD